ncbi:MAG TPA: response regulator transcription factor [Roseimicrobium sp.]|nr:response regulator transcription factor [Roseimicrobium sp.]
MSIRVSLVEDEDGIRENLATLINGASGFVCLSTHSSAEEALRELPEKKPDVVLMDINLPSMSGIDCVQKLKQLLPQTQILMLTMYEDSDQIFRSLMAGANGYLLKRTAPDKLLEAIQEVHRGASPMSGKIARIVVQYFQGIKPKVPDTEKLSKREEEILELLAKGYRYKEIADALGISFDTVRSHLRNIYDKLHVSSRTEAVVKYLAKEGQNDPLRRDSAKPSV